ncbi:MAG: GIY-YIG nuclease family protein [Hydromonas sp.]|nr:GIY-YIG nuclease family protein [Hydromonas sp.]
MKKTYTKKDFNGIAGTVYVLRNTEYTSNVLKIGLTTRAIEKRIEELEKDFFQTHGYPAKYICCYSVDTFDCGGLEKRVHECLRRHQNPNERSEFFDISVSEAQSVIELEDTKTANTGIIGVFRSAIGSKYENQLFIAYSSGLSKTAFTKRIKEIKNDSSIALDKEGLFFESNDLLSDQSKIRNALQQYRHRFFEDYYLYSSDGRPSASKPTIPELKNILEETLQNGAIGIQRRSQIKTRRKKTRQESILFTATEQDNSLEEYSPVGILCVVAHHDFENEQYWVKMTSCDEPTLISNLNNNRPTGVRPNFYAEYALRIRTEHQDILSDLLAPAIASFRHENSDWLRTSFDELKCIVDEVYLRVYPSLDIALDTRGARKEAERQRQLQIENEKKEQLLREAAAKDLAEKAEKERKEALINKQLSVLEEKRQKTLAQYKTRLEAELPNQSYWYWFVRTLLTFSVASAIFWVVGRTLTGNRNFGDVSDGVFISAILVVTLFAALFAKDHYENKAKNSEPYKIILSECDAEIALIDKEKNNLR